jgi:hypothetical protein
MGGDLTVESTPTPAARSPCGCLEPDFGRRDVRVAGRTLLCALRWKTVRRSAPRLGASNLLSIASVGFMPHRESGPPHQYDASAPERRWLASSAPRPYEGGRGPIVCAG